jgi:hypothetical protein
MKLKTLVPLLGAAAACAAFLWISPASGASVFCEPQGGGNPFHPPTYWFDVDSTNGST